MKWVIIDGTHVNTDQIQSFYWLEGELVIWHAASAMCDKLEDPEQRIYKKLCRDLGVRPVGEGDL